MKEDLEDAHEQQYLMLKRLEDTEIERDRLLAELEEREKEVHMITGIQFKMTDFKRLDSHFYNG